MRVPYCPHEPTRRQRAFLALDDFEALYGGQASGGKSDALLMAALQFVEVPGYSAILFRRTHQDLALPGALMDRALLWLADPIGRGEVRWDSAHKQLRFPSGAVLSFGYMESDQDRHRYKSAEFQFVGFDELTTFSELQYLYLASRVRRLAGAPVITRMRSATNPGDVGHAWVKARFVDPGDRSRPFVRAAAEDNPHVDLDDYRKHLSILDRTTYDQLARGLWVLDATNRVYHYDATHDVDALPSLDGWERILAIDLGSSTRDPTTAFVELAYHEHDPSTYVVCSHKEAGIIPSTLAEYVLDRVTQHERLQIVIDAGGLGGGYIGELQTRYGIPAQQAEKSDKAGARRLINGALEQGRLRLVRGACDGLARELDSLVYDKRGMDVAPGLADHESDALLYGWRLSQAHRAVAAPVEPAHGSPEWWKLREKQKIEQEIADARRRHGPEGFASW